MKNQTAKEILGMTAVIMVSAAVFTGCGQKEEGSSNSSAVQSTAGTQSIVADSGTGEDLNMEADNNDETDVSAQTQPGAEVNSGSEDTVSEQTQLEVRFGDEGEPFMMRLEDNETAAAIARYVGTSDWRLPIYERDKDADFEVMQYYDIPDRYDIPSNAENVTSAKTGDVFYSDPNRIVLYYHDAEISEEYTKIGTFDPTEEFVAAVEENPVLEGWGNKIILIARP